MDFKKEYVELIKFAKKNNSKILTSLEDFHPGKKIKFECSDCGKPCEKISLAYMKLPKCHSCNIPMVTYTCIECGELQPPVKKYNLPKTGKCRKCASLKTSYEDVKKFIEESGSKLKTKKSEYTGVKQKLSIICGECKNPSKKTFKAFKEAPRCKSCSHHLAKTGQTKDDTFEKLEKQFREKGFVLISTKKDYKNQHSKLEYVCAKGHNSFTTANRFNAEHSCNECATIPKRAYSHVKTKFEKLGHKLLIDEDNYKNKKQYLEFVCGECNKHDTVQWATAKNESWVCCKTCTRDKTRYDFDFVKAYFEKAGCELLETKYKNINDLLSFKCICGEKGKSSFKYFRQGRRCNKCKMERTEKTNIEKYGGKNVMFDKEIFAKSVINSYKRKEYIFPSGRMEYVMGYEPTTIDELLKEGIEEDDIECTIADVPKIIYIGEDNKEHPYFPDIFIKSKNKIIEVKSEYIYQKDREKNERKWKETAKIYDLEVRIYDKRGKRVLRILYD